MKPTSTTPAATVTDAMSPAEHSLAESTQSPTPATSTTTPVVDFQVVQTSLDRLTPHPKNTAIYGDEAVDDELVASITDHGVLTPIRVTADHVIIDGHRRFQACRAAGQKTVPAIFLEAGHDELAVDELLLEANRTRLKNNEQRVREFMEYQNIEAERAKMRQGRRTDILSKSAGCQANDPTGTARELAAKKVGLGGTAAAEGKKVVAVIDQFLGEHKHADADHLRKTLCQRSIHAALREAVGRGWIPEAGKKRTARTKATDRGAAAGGKPADQPDNAQGQVQASSSVEEAQADPAAERIAAIQSQATEVRVDTSTPAPQTDHLRDRPLPPDNIMDEPTAGSAVKGASVADAVPAPASVPAERLSNNGVLRGV